MEAIGVLLMVLAACIAVVAFMGLSLNEGSRERSSVQFLRWERFGGLGVDCVAVVLMEGQERRVFGCRTIWHFVDTGDRLGTFEESHMSDRWSHERFKRQEATNA